MARRRQRKQRGRVQAQADAEIRVETGGGGGPEAAEEGEEEEEEVGEDRPLLASAGGRGKPNGSAKQGGYGAVPRTAESGSTSRPGHGAKAKSRGTRSKSGVLLLLRHASCGDRLLMLGGCLFAALHGVSFPVLALVFGSMTNTFLNFTETSTDPDSVPVWLVPSNESAASTEPTAEFLSALTDYMAHFSLYYVALGGIVLVTSSLQVFCWEMACERQVHRLRRRFFEQVVRQDIAWFDEKGAGDAPTLISDDLERVREGIGSKLGLVVQYAATLISGLAVGLLACWRLTVALMAVGPVLVAASAIMAQVVATASKTEQKRYAAAGAVAGQALHGIRTVAAFGGQRREAERYEQALDAGVAEAIKKYRNLMLSLSCVHFLTYGTYGLAFWYGATLIGRGLATPGGVFTVFFSVLAGAFSIGNSLPFIFAASTAAGAIKGVMAVVERVPDIDPYDTAGLRPNRLEGRIQFRAVSFEYPTRPDVPVLRDLTLTVQPGTTVALVGSSGAGKSTVVRLLLRFHDVAQGEVLLDNIDVRCLNLSWLRSKVGVVAQDPVLFATSILENIRLGRADATDEEVMEAARTANAHAFIVALPEGYDTMVGESGTQLSGGQRQRVAIARALVRDPAILLLDEATSALDAESEATVQAALDRAARGRTTLVIAHRLSTVRHADVIHAMRDGVVEESGTHEELLARGGLYSQLVAAQHGAQADEDDDDDDNDNDDSENDDSENDDNEACVASSGDGPAMVEEEHVDDEVDFRQVVQHPAVTTSSERVVRVDDDDDDMGTVDLPKVKLGRLFRIGRPEFLWVVLGVLGCALNGSIIPIFAFFYGEVFHTFTLSGPALQQSALFWTYMFLALAAFSAAAWCLQITSLTWASERLVLRLRLLAFRNILAQAVGWFDRDSCSPDKLANRLARDAPAVKAAAGWRIGQVVQALVTLAEALLISFLFGWKLALVLVAAVPFIVTAYYQQSMTVRHHQRRDTELMAKAVRVATESVTNIQMVQALGRERYFLGQFSAFLQEPFRESKKHAYVYALVFALAQSLIYVMYAVAFRLGAYLIETGEMTSINVYRVFFALAFCAPQVGITSAFLQDFNKAKMAVGLMMQLLDRKPDIDCRPSAGLRPEVRGRVSLRGVHFRYPSRPDVEVLRGLSLDVEPGRTLALVGASGCGKSTVLALIERFYEPCDGAVLVDDMDIRCVNVQYLRAHIGLVTQDAALFDCSIRDNIAYGLKAAARDNAEPGAIPFRAEHYMTDIITAAKTANIHDFIVGLPQGYDTMVGERGAQLSGGQRQRVAIARALVRDPAILLLDEATSALDTESEKVVQEALEKARRGRTCVVVAHRLSTVRGADCIAVLQRGQVVEQGTHAQLVARGGRYSRLVQRQRL